MVTYQRPKNLKWRVICAGVQRLCEEQGLNEEDVALWELDPVQTRLHCISVGVLDRQSTQPVSVSSLGARVFELGVALVRARVRLRRRRRRRARDAHDTVPRGVRVVVVVHLLAPTSRSASRHERAGVLGISDGGGRRARAR